jgi:hypothetical protein
LDDPAGKPMMDQLLQTTIATMNCPSRRPSLLIPAGPYASSYWYGYTSPGQVARSDYAACAGDAGYLRAVDTNPQGTVTAATYDWFDWGPANVAGAGTWAWPTGATGVIIQHSATPVKEIPDGLSHTFLIGEKYMQADYYYNGLDGADNQNMYLGFDWDVNRWANPSCLLYRDRPGIMGWEKFGSAHPAVCQFVFCDGSVHSLSFTTDGDTLACLAARNDRHTPDGSKY